MNVCWMYCLPRAYDENREFCEERTMTNWTKEQQDVISCVTRGDTPTSVRAVAGSGKTTTLVGAVTSLSDAKPLADITCVAFNKAIADTLASKMPSGVTCKTMHALGHASWRRRLGDTKLNVDGRKFWSCLRQLRGDDYRLPDEWEDLPRLVSLFKQAGYMPDDAEATLAGEELADHHDLFFPEETKIKAFVLANDILRESVRLAHQGQIDFDDMLYMPICYGGTFVPQDYVLIDEAQDISWIQQEMLARLCGQHGVLHAVGDPHQAIYGFRGATAESMDEIASRFSQQLLSLTYTFRCPRAVTCEAQSIVPHIQCPLDAPEGSVRSLSQWSSNDLPKRCAILCRNVRPLVSLAYTLLAQGVPCFLAGRDIGKGLIKLIEMMRTDDIDKLIVRLDDYEDKQRTLLLIRGADAKAAALEDKIASIFAITAQKAFRNVDELKASIASMFADQGQRGIVLSTIHKAKGLEWDDVFILDRNLIPSRFARSAWQLEQENNLMYVAVTRALRNLTYITTEGLR